MQISKQLTQELFDLDYRINSGNFTNGGRIERDDLIVDLITELEKRRTEDYWESLRVVTQDLSDQGTSRDEQIARLLWDRLKNLLLTWSEVRRAEFPAAPDYTLAELQELASAGGQVAA